MLTRDETLDFPGLHRRPARCRLRVIEPNSPGRPTVMVLSELADNPGASITNAAEQAWQAAARRTGLYPGSGLEPHTAIYIEHYPGDRYHRPETFDVVTFDDPQTFTGPEWRPLGPLEFSELIGQPGGLEGVTR